MWFSLVWQTASSSEPVYPTTCVTIESTTDLPSNSPFHFLVFPFLTFVKWDNFLALVSQQHHHEGQKNTPFPLFSRQNKSFEAVVLQEAVQTDGGHGLVLALLNSPLSLSSLLLSQDNKGDLLQLIYKGPGWAVATERNNYSQLLPICPTMSNSNLSGWCQHSHPEGWTPAHP